MKWCIGTTKGSGNVISLGYKAYSPTSQRITNRPWYTDFKAIELPVLLMVI